MSAGRKTINGAGPRVAVAGCGYWGRNLVRNFYALGALAAVYDRHDGRADSLALRFDTASLSFEQILADDSIAAVAIATPAEVHFAMAREALLAGKHVFVEKPLALGTDKAETLCAQADKMRRTLMVGHVLRYHPAFVRLVEMVQGDEFGRLHYIYANRLDQENLRSENDILWCLAPHDVSMILALVGTKPTSVSAVGGSYREPGIVDLVTMQLAFPEGRTGHVFLSWLHPFKEHRLVVVGGRATAVFDDCRGWPEKLVVYPADRAGSASPVRSSRSSPWRSNAAISSTVLPRAPAHAPMAPRVSACSTSSRRRNDRLRAAGQSRSSEAAIFARLPTALSA